MKIKSLVPTTPTGMWVVAVGCTVLILGSQTYLQVTDERTANLIGWVVPVLASAANLSAAAAAHLIVWRMDRRVRERNRELLRRHSAEAEESPTDIDFDPGWHR